LASKRYSVKAVVTGNTVNEVASKLMVAAYTQDFELEELDIQELPSQREWLQEEEDVDLTEKFHFPHVQELLSHLRKTEPDADRPSSQGS
jgi:hypothetical protein